MSDAIPTILAISAPLLFATLGALCTEYAGVLAVFMDGAITLSGFVCIAVTGATGSPLAGFFAACLASVALLFAVARFTARTRANPFLTGLAVNLLASGITSWCSSAWYDTRGVIALASPVSFPRNLAFPFAFLAAALLAAALRSTRAGLNLRITGSDPDVLTARGVDPARYRVASWCAAAFFAACAGSVLTLGLGAFVPNVSSGRGWTALAAVYLGYRNPLLCVASCVAFAGAEYLTTVIQGLGRLPSTVILGLPYALALLVFILVPGKKR